MKLADKNHQEITQKVITTDRKVLIKIPKSYHLDQLQQMARVPTTNKLQLVSNNKDPAITPPRSVTGTSYKHH